MNSLSHKICTHNPVIALLLLSFLMLTLSIVSPAYAYDLTLGNTGSGSGDINGTVTCTIGALGGCTTPLPDGTPVTLTANPDWKSIFEGWGSPCSGTGSCVFTLNADTLIVISFSPNYQALVVGHQIAPNFATLAEAYADANDQNAVAANVYIFHEDLVLNQAKFVRFYLGKPPGLYFADPVGFTTLLGSLTIQQGAVEVDSLIIQ